MTKYVENERKGAGGKNQSVEEEGRDLFLFSC